MLIQCQSTIEKYVDNALHARLHLCLPDSLKPDEVFHATQMLIYY